MFKGSEMSKSLDRFEVLPVSVGLILLRVELVLILAKVDIYLTQVAPTGSMAGYGGIPAEPEGI
jgi:hypothetical protein